jgi:hypothetical protein
MGDRGIRSITYAGISPVGHKGWIGIMPHALCLAYAFLFAHHLLLAEQSGLDRHRVEAALVLGWVDALKTYLGWEHNELHHPPSPSLTLDRAADRYP